LLLALSLTTVSCAMISLPAFADRKGARFSFAPNIYPVEQSQIPEVSVSPRSAHHAVKAGQVPTGKDILGIDPNSLPKVPSAEEIAETQAKLMRSHYQDSFGTPNNMPALAALPKTLAPMSLPSSKPTAKPSSARRDVHGKLLNRKNSNRIGTDVRGKLLKKNGAAGQSARALALKPASYGKDFGYAPGSFTPSSSGDGMSVKTGVYGTLLHH